MTLLRWLTFLLGSQTDSHSPALLDLFISSDAGIVLQWFSLHWEILIILLSQFPLTFPSNSQGDAPFHRISYDYFRADWDGLRDHLRDVL